MAIEFGFNDEVEFTEHKSDKSAKSEVSEASSEQGWSDDIETLLKDIEFNSGILSQIHKENYYYSAFRLECT